MSVDKLLRANVQILAAYPEAVADWEAPTAAELNNQFAWGTNEGAMVFNISCAISDDYTAGQEASETDDTLTICDIGNNSTLTFKNYSVSLDGMRDRDYTAEGVFNLFFNLFKGQDRPFYIIVRVGKMNDAPYLTDGSDIISIYGIDTDNPTDGVEDNSLMYLGARFKTTGEINTFYGVIS